MIFIIIVILVHRVSVLWGPGVHYPNSLTILRRLDPLFSEFGVVFDTWPSWFVNLDLLTLQVSATPGLLHQQSKIHVLLIMRF